jgi:hypothetical protein
MKKWVLLFSFITVFHFGFSQNASDQFLMHDIQTQIIPTDYPFYYLMQKYSGHGYWSTHIKNLPLLRSLQNQVDNNLLIINPLDNVNIANDGAWDCEIIERPRCITDSAKNKILKDDIVIIPKWWYSKKKINTLYKQAKALAADKRAKLPIFEKVVYSMQEPWILNKGLLCLVYVMAEYDNEKKVERIYVFAWKDEKWVLQNTIE